MSWFPTDSDWEESIVSTRVSLGRSGLEVSRFCLGTLPMGPLQAHLTVERGADLILKAVDLGVNFLDSAEIYRTYPYIRRAMDTLRKSGRGADMVIATKSYAYTSEGMQQSLYSALREMNVEQIGAFLLHEQESRLTLEGHGKALERLLEAKNEGLVRAVGVSSHSPECVRACARMDEIDIIHPLINMRGLGILVSSSEDADREQRLPAMLSAIREASEAGKGIYAMKALGGGNLFTQVEDALGYVKSIPWIHSVAVGVLNEEELLMDLAILEGRDIPRALKERVKENSRRKRLFIEEWCTGCGSCVSACPSRALTMEASGPKVNEDKCVLCGYCSAECRDFCIKVV